MWRVAVVVVGIALVGGCGGSGQDAATQLAIERQTGPPAAAMSTSRATLRCDGTAVATGFLRNVAGPACALVDTGAIQQVASDQHSRQLCSQIYGGPQTAHITGTVDGRSVDLTVARTDGCGTATWQTLEPLLGDPQRVGPLKRSSAPTTAG